MLQHPRYVTNQKAFMITLSAMGLFKCSFLPSSATLKATREGLGAR